MSRAQGRQIHLAVMALAMLLGLAAPSIACFICLPAPERSDADAILEAGAVALARENPERPYTYQVLEVLKGSPQPGEIDNLVDATAKRELDAAAAAQAVLVKLADGTWSTTGVRGPRMLEMLRKVIRFAPHGNASERQRLERARFFLPHLEDADRDVARTAHLEIARLTYADLRTLSRDVRREELRGHLRGLANSNRHPLHLLLLGFAGNEGDRRYLRNRIEEALLRGRKDQLSAMASAYIEMGGADAVADIVDKTVAVSASGTGLLGEILQALSLHGGEGRTELRGFIITGYGRLLDAWPLLAGPIANDLRQWRRSELTGKLGAILLGEAAPDEASILSIRAYLLSTGSSDGLDALRRLEQALK